MPGVLCSGAWMWLVGTWQLAGDKTSLKQAISSQEGRAAFPAPLPLPWQWFPGRCQLPAYIRMFESLFLFWRAGALPPLSQSGAPCSPGWLLLAWCPCSAPSEEPHSLALALAGARLVPGSCVGLHRSHTSAQACPAPGQGDSRWGGRVVGLLGTSLMPAPLPEHLPSQGTPVTGIRLDAAALPVAGSTGRECSGGAG